jgi:hypothetical protein
MSVEQGRSVLDMKVPLAEGEQWRPKLDPEGLGAHFKVDHSRYFLLAGAKRCPSMGRKPLLQQ